MSKVSVIICTHNPRVDYLSRVLAGLRAQTLSLTDWELLLVDNGSQVPLSVRFDLSWHPNARHIREEELGLTPARLRGIRESKSEILIFVDDDTVLATDYFQQALTIQEQWPFVGVWGGSCVPEYETPLPDWVGDQVWRLTVFEVTDDVWGNVRDGFETKPVGAGMCVRNIVARQYAGWCRRRAAAKIMDRTGAALGGYGDQDLSQCAIDLGLGTGRSSKLMLTHLIPASRLTQDYFVRHAEGDASSLMLFRASRGLPIKEPRPISWLQRMRWRLHRVFQRVPREQYEIQMAHQRGLEKGWQLASQLFPAAVSAKSKA